MDPDASAIEVNARRLTLISIGSVPSSVLVNVGRLKDCPQAGHRGDSYGHSALQVGQFMLMLSQNLWYQIRCDTGYFPLIGLL
jgi:hypothetical protein